MAEKIGRDKSWSEREWERDNNSQLIKKFFINKEYTNVKQLMAKTRTFGKLNEEEWRQWAHTNMWNNVKEFFIC